MTPSSLRKFVKYGRASRRKRRYRTVRHQTLHCPSVPSILEVLGVHGADRATQQHAVQRAAQIGWLFPRERELMRSAGFPGV